MIENRQKLNTPAARSPCSVRLQAHLSALAQERGQKLTHLFRLLLVSPVTGALHHMHAFELGEAGLADVHGSTDRPIGTPVFSGSDHLRGHVDRAAGERLLLGDTRTESAAPDPIVPQRAGPAAARIFLSVHLTLRFGEPLA